MKIIEPMVIVPKLDFEQITKMLRKLEVAGRTCYKTESKGKYEAFLAEKIAHGHESIIEHESISVIFICDRGVSHELVRHRIGSYSQESTRYCNYSKDRFGNELTFIKPFYFDEDSIQYDVWVSACRCAENAYLTLLESGATPQEARSVLPNSLKTEVFCTFNMREWRTVFKQRAQRNAHPQMQQLMIPLLLWFKYQFTCLFYDIEYNKDFDSRHYAKIYFTDILEDGNGEWYK